VTPCDGSGGRRVSDPAPGRDGLKGEGGAWAVILLGRSPFRRAVAWLSVSKLVAQECRYRPETAGMQSPSVKSATHFEH
jgi:hypothetical protein